jgi:hypothetical protein
MGFGAFGPKRARAAARITAGAIMTESQMITLDSMLLAALVTMTSILAWFIRGYVKQDAEWKKMADKKLDDLSAIRVVCVKEFATQSSVNELFRLARDHGGRISALEGGRQGKASRRRTDESAD